MIKKIDHMNNTTINDVQIKLFDLNEAFGTYKWTDGQCFNYEKVINASLACFFFYPFKHKHPTIMNTARVRQAAVEEFCTLQ